MSARSANDLAREDPWNMDEDVAEVPLLLPTSQVAALQERAHLEGLTAGQFLRRLISQYCPPQYPAARVQEIDCV
jgi:hypothetical protein